MLIRKTPLDESFWLYEEPELLKSLTPQEAMGLACQIALKGVGSVHKNPLVGTVLVDRQHRFLAAAAHLAYGQEHAEINLIECLHKRQLENHLADSILYTTLEPCSHVGKTRPCVEALSKVPLKEVIYGSIDPNPLVAGKGIAYLEDKKIACTHSSEFEIMGAHLLEHFRWNLMQKTPYIAIKAALSLNGMAAYSGDQRAWITCERSRNYGHWLRNDYEAILVGANTVIRDNPTLNIRHPKFKGRTPLRIVLDPEAKALLARPLHKHHLLSVEPHKTLWICKSSVWKKNSALMKEIETLGAHIHSLEKNWNLKNLVEFFASQNIASLLLEGGPHVWGSFLNEGLVNKLYVFLAPKLFSGNAMNFARAFEPHSNIELTYTTLTCLEEDFLMEAKIERKEDLR